ncbi:hypothetical protein [Nostocoides australiense]
MDGFPARALGGRFGGRNRRVENGVPREWIGPCDVVAYDPARLFAYTVGDRFDATPATRWSYLITPTNEGCLVRQEFEHLPDGLSGLRLRAEELDDAEVIIAVRREEIRAGMTLTLERMRKADEVEAALRALEGEDPPFITKLERRASGGIGLVGKPTGHARRAVGAGPTLESIADRLITALDEAADREPDPERKGWLRKTAAYLGNAGRDLAVDIGASAINRQMGM